MHEQSLHRGLELRLETLSDRIRTLKQKTARLEGIQKLQSEARVAELEQRRNELEARMQELNSQGKGFQQSLKDEIDMLTYDLGSNLDDYVMRLDSEYDQPPPPGVDKRIQG
ncbi:MAG: hypothetical protein WBX25_26465 [Rhodomicrobium sp.]